MAKFGVEVEGKLAGQGVKTYFCNAREYAWNPDLMQELIDLGAEMVYISDHHNELDLDDLEEQFAGSGIKVTVELTELHDVPPQEIEIFWNVSQASYAQSRTILFLRPSDQIKMEHEKHVIAFEVGEGVFTLPEDFDGDVEL